MSEEQNLRWVAAEVADIGAILGESARSLVPAKADGKSLTLVRKGQEFYAIDGKCPHQGGPLAEGHFDEAGNVVCPWHRFAFDPASGKCESGGYFVNTFPVRRVKNGLQIGLPPSKPWWKLW